MYWHIHVRDTKAIEDYSNINHLEKQRVIELSWGWTPFGQTPDGEPEETLEGTDIPYGHESVYILEEQIPSLIEKLQKIYDKSHL